MWSKFRNTLEDRREQRARLRTYRAISAISDHRAQADAYSTFQRSLH